MRTLLVALFAFVLCGALFGLASAVEPHQTLLPPGGVIVPPGDYDPRVPCDISLRYDDGTDDTPGSGPTLGWWSGVDHQFLGVRFTTPAGTGEYQVQSASFYTDFWVIGGNVNFTVYELADPTNTTTATIFAGAGGTYEVEFATPICVPAGTDYAVMLCPDPGVWGVVGQDLSASQSRSYWTMGGCTADNPSPDNYMLWSCVTPCGGTPTENVSWGRVKGLYH